eukprot:TRINITY_DN2678_c0_g2_i2.p1 TRINITY_DN2678_c0_g2~~TRINITY_DN2678_c0_g2_i2.p1  ORF type:complete len:190 (-),score=19.87 TRINITY_DN2678_c0_g2_i2:2-571(-)
MCIRDRNNMSEKKEEKVNQVPIEELPNASKSEGDAENAFCSSVTILVLGILSFQVFVILFAIFALIATNGVYETWQRWKKTVIVFFYIALAALIVTFAIFISYTVIHAVKKKYTEMGLAIYILVISIAVLIFMICFKGPFQAMYNSNRAPSREVPTYSHLNPHSAQRSSSLSHPIFFYLILPKIPCTLR